MVLNLFFKFRFILVLACLKNYKRHDAKFCSVKCFERVHVLQMSPVHVLQMSPVHVLQMSPVHVLQMSPVHVLQMSPVHVLQMSPVHVLQMSPVQVLQNESSPCFTNESSPGFTSPVQSMFYNMPTLTVYFCFVPRRNETVLYLVSNIVEQVIQSFASILAETSITFWII